MPSEAHLPVPEMRALGWSEGRLFNGLVPASAPAPGSTSSTKP